MDTTRVPVGMGRHQRPHDHDHDHETGPRSEAARPTRDGDQNQAAVVTSTTDTSDDLLLPSLSPGLTLFEADTDDGRPLTELQSVVIDHLLTADGPAFWVDAQGYATSSAFRQLAPSDRLLDRVAVARAFTAYQHFDALCGVKDAVQARIRAVAAADSLRRRRADRQHRSAHDTDEAPHAPSLVVAPAVDSLYRAASLAQEPARSLLGRALARLRSFADGYDIPVVVTVTDDDRFADTVRHAADHDLTCRRTEYGPRFTGDDFETLLYPVGDGWYQTTLAFWQRCLRNRARRVGISPTSTDDAGVSTPTVGTGVTVDGTAPLTPSPLRDAGGPRVREGF